MILVIEDLIKESIDSISPITVGGNALTTNIKFHYGLEDELHQYLKLKDTAQESKYPLCWLKSGFKEEHLGYGVVIDASFIIATLNKRTDWLNDQRLSTSFKQTLIPTLNALINKFKSSNVQIQSDELEIYKHYNYSVETGIADTDIWDAIEWRVKLLITKKC